MATFGRMEMVLTVSAIESGPVLIIKVNKNKGKGILAVERRTGFPQFCF